MSCFLQRGKYLIPCASHFSHQMHTGNTLFTTDRHNLCCSETIWSVLHTPQHAPTHHNTDRHVPGTSKRHCMSYGTEHTPDTGRHGMLRALHRYRTQCGAYRPMSHALQMHTIHTMPHTGTHLINTLHSLYTHHVHSLHTPTPFRNNLMHNTERHVYLKHFRRHVERGVHTNTPRYSCTPEVANLLHMCHR